MTARHRSRPPRWVPALALASLLVLGAALLSCAGDDDTARLRVVTSTPLLAEFTGAVAGDRAAVESLIPPGVEIHAFEPTTAAARAIARADLLVLNGYRLEEGLLDVVSENRPDETPVVVAAADLEPLAGASVRDEEADAGGLPAPARAEGDPHFWLAVPNAIHYVERIRDALAEVDPDGAAGYDERAAAFSGRLRTLDAELRERLAAVPQERRRIVTFHDAFGYLAREYGFEVVATVAPSGANVDPSAAALARVIEIVRERDVPAVFAEPQFASGVLDAVADETGAEVRVLYATFTGEVRTYEALMRANAEQLVEGLRPRT